MSEQRNNKRVKKYCFEMLLSLENNVGDTLKSGQKYCIDIQGIDATNDINYEYQLENFVYDPSTFKQKMEEVLCSWTKGNKVTVTKFELWDMDEYNNGWIDIQWK